MRQKRLALSPIAIQQSIKLERFMLLAWLNYEHRNDLVITKHGAMEMRGNSRGRWGRTNCAQLVLSMS